MVEAAPIPEPTTLPLYLRRLRGLSWNGFRFTLPERWEVTGYALKPAVGRFQFHAQSQAMGELSWRTLDGTPDLPRILGEGLRRYLEAEQPDAVAGFQAATCQREGEWLLAWHAPGAPLLAGLWKANQRILLQWFFPSFSPETFAQAQALLAQYQSNESEPREWRLFGIGMALPGEFAFDELEASSAFCTLRWENPAGLQVVARRIGMVEQALAGGSLADCYRRILNRSASRVLDLADADFGGRPAVRIDFERKGVRRMDALSGRWWQGRGYLWLDAQEGRLYSCEQVGPPRPPRLELAHAWR